MTNDALLDKATARHRAGDLAEARRLYEEVLAAAPSDSRALFRSGLLDLQESRPASALARIEHALALEPDDPRYRMGFGRSLQALGRFTEAVAAYRMVLATAPDDADARFALATALHSAGLGAEAVAAYRAALAMDPRNADAGNNLGVLLCEGRYYAEAAEVLRRALAVAPAHAAATFNLGKALQGQGDARAAITMYRQAVALGENSTEALCNLGNAHKELGELDQAHACYAAALRDQPDSVVALNNLGCLLRTLGHLDEAEQTLRRAIALEPGRAALHGNLGNVLKDAGELDAAIDEFRRSLEFDPSSAETHSNLAYSLSFQAATHEPALAECRRWNTRFAAGLSRWAQAGDLRGAPDRRLRVGYVSPDFRDHCQTSFTLPVLSHHDHDAFEIFCYSDVARADACTARIAACADAWRETRRLDDDALAARIREDRIDILVDLTMHMAGGRPGVFARKPAPLQICWLAYPGTTGIDAIDYRLSDSRLDPVEHDAHYSERTIRLPDSFWCYDPLTAGPAVGPPPALERGFVTFGCLNNPCKLTDATLDLWAPVLRELPESRLVLMTPPGRRRELQARRFEARGVDPARLDFVGFRPRAEYLAGYLGVDIGLDTTPYNGHTTSLDALWMGVPVVSRVGRTAVGRGGLSQLHHVGLARLAAGSDAAFTAAAAGLARDLAQVADIRATLRRRLEASPLMDGARFARNLEHAYRSLWSEHAESPGR